MLGVPKADWTDAFRRTLHLGMRSVAIVADSSTTIAKGIEVFSRELIEAVGWVGRSGERAPFTIPATLLDQWRLRNSEAAIGS